MRWASIIMCIMFTGMCSCRSTVRTSLDPLGTTPMDFSIDATILTGKDLESHDEAHLKQSRFVLLADGSLHYGADPKRGADWMPDQARRLNRRQVADLWSLARQIGYADPDNGGEPTNFKLVHPDPDEIVYLFMFTGSQRRWAFISRSDSIESADAASVQFVRRLARLAWVTDLPESSSRIPPRRYDFGPDPYARYRK